MLFLRLQIRRGVLASLAWVVSLFLSSASEAKDYVIPAGNHYAQQTGLALFRGDTLRFKAMFDSSAIYNLGNEDQLDANKLYGAADCSSAHMENSARFGWRWNQNRLEIMAVTHRGGTFYVEFVGVAELGKVYDFEIQLSPDKNEYLYRFQGGTVRMARGCTASVMSGYKLYPYFGGNQVAPHAVRIKVEDRSDDFALAALDLVYPNPTTNRQIKLDFEVGEDLELGFEIFDLSGRKVQEAAPVPYSGGTSVHGFELSLNDFSAGMYLIRPYAVKDGKVKSAFVGAPGNAIMFLML